MGKLTDKQELFCKEYIIDLNATQAAIRAGYKECNANKQGPANLVKQGISERIAELVKERNERVQIDADWVLLSAKKVFDRCMQEEEITSREGESTGEWKFEHSGANKALEIIGRHVKVRAFDADKDETTKGSEVIHKVQIEVIDAS